MYTQMGAFVFHTTSNNLQSLRYRYERVQAKICNIIKIDRLDGLDQTTSLVLSSSRCFFWGYTTDLNKSPMPLDRRPGAA